MFNQTAFGGTLQELIELTSIVLRPEPLDTEIERRCKRAWEQALCPECEATAVKTNEDSSRIWCSNCRHTFTYTHNTPFEGRTLRPGEVVIAFVLYADTLLSINRIAQLFDAVYDTIHSTIREVEAAFKHGFPPSGSVSSTRWSELGSPQHREGTQDLNSGTLVSAAKIDAVNDIPEADSTGEGRQRDHGADCHRLNVAGGW